MTRTTLTLLTCAALAAPSIALADEAPDRAPEDPRAQVTTGFGPQAYPAPLVPPQSHPVSLVPQAEAQGPANDFVPAYVAAAGATGGLLLGGMIGFAVADGTSACKGGSTDPFTVATGVLGCFAGITRGALLGAAGGALGAVVGSFASSAIYHAYQAHLRVAPVAGPGAAGLTLSGSF